MSLSIEFQSRNGYFPNYDGIDFRELRIASLAKENLEAVECWLVIDELDDKYEQQITQDNCHVEMNSVEPVMDRVGIQDERDNQWWTWFRDEVPEFEEFLANIAAYGKVVHTMYPQPDVAEQYMKRKDNEIGESINCL